MGWGDVKLLAMLGRLGWRGVMMLGWYRGDRGSGRGKTDAGTFLRSAWWCCCGLLLARLVWVQDHDDAVPPLPRARVLRRYMTLGVAGLVEGTGRGRLPGSRCSAARYHAALRPDGWGWSCSQERWTGARRVRSACDGTRASSGKRRQHVAGAVGAGVGLCAGGGVRRRRTATRAHRRSLAHGWAVLAGGRPRCVPGLGADAPRADCCRAVRITAGRAGGPLLSAPRCGGSKPRRRPSACRRARVLLPRGVVWGGSHRSTSCGRTTSAALAGDSGGGSWRRAVLGCVGERVVRCDAFLSPRPAPASATFFSDRIAGALERTLAERGGRWQLGGLSAGMATAAQRAGDDPWLSLPRSRRGTPRTLRRGDGAGGRAGWAAQRFLRCAARAAPPAL